MGRYTKHRRTSEERRAAASRRHDRLRWIKGRYCHVDRYHGPFWHAGDQFLGKFVRELDAPGPILAACNDRHLRRLEQAVDGRRVVWQVDRPIPEDDVLLGNVSRRPDASAPLEKLKFSAPLAGAFVCERLQRAPNVHDYLTALRRSVAHGAPVCIVVPNAHYELVDDHLNLFTAGTLVYNMIRAGWNCKDAEIEFDKRFINVLLWRVDVPEPIPTKIDDIGKFTPFKNVFQYCTSEFVEVYRDAPP